jgi:hypothetical protein
MSFLCLGATCIVIRHSQATDSVKTSLLKSTALTLTLSSINRPSTMNVANIAFYQTGNDALATPNASLTFRTLLLVLYLASYMSGLQSISSDLQIKAQMAFSPKLQRHKIVAQLVSILVGPFPTNLVHA